MDGYAIPVSLGTLRHSWASLVRATQPEDGRRTFLAKQFYWPARYLDHGCTTLQSVSLERGDIVEHHWFGRLQRGQQIRTFLAKAVLLASALSGLKRGTTLQSCQFGVCGDIVEHPEIINHID